MSRARRATRTTSTTRTTTTAMTKVATMTMRTTTAMTKVATMTMTTVAARAGLALALGGLILAADARPARACGESSGGGGSSSGDSSSGGSSGGGGGYDSSAAVYTPACVDGTTVVGYRACAPYGTWGTLAQLPKVSVDVGLWSSMIDLGGVDVGGTVTHSDGSSYAYRVVGSELGNDADVVGVRSRMLVHRGGLYFGLEGGVGGVVAPAVDSRQPMAQTDLSSKAGMVAVGGVVAGGRVFAGRLSIGGEVMAGVRGLSVSSTSTHGACVVEDLHWDREATVEVRARGDLWLTPWMTAGAYLGRDALGGQTSGGLDLGFHLRAFDGH